MYTHESNSRKRRRKNLGNRYITKKTLLKKQNNLTYIHVYFPNKLLEQYPNLYKKYSSENINYYEINVESLYPICKLNYEDEEGIKDEYKDKSYYIKYEASEISTVIPVYAEIIV
ncbi:hypothetical protein Glove_26g197 [Diversispora epigaea]|uniref:Uncharacterized protein n=1 Tax=Diversispora epigaea TaxID=1348612 RepID=A0A397JQ50_9GLOM|nr:hypothetical protein Glove_26g197 [Diversispora epigaea]